MDCKHRIEQVGQVDAVSFCHETIKSSVSIEAPRSADLNDLQPRLVGSVKDLISDLPARRAIDERERIRAVPIGLLDRDKRIGHYSAHCGAWLQVFEFHGFSGDCA